MRVPLAGLLLLAPALLAQPPLIPGHPRLVFRSAATPIPARTFEQVRALYAEDAFFRSVFDHTLATPPAALHPAMAAAAWIVTGDDKHAMEAARLLLNTPIKKTTPGDYSNIWSFALAFDWLYHHPALSPDQRELAANRIGESLEAELAELDAAGMALWHGRNQAANGAMIAALAIGDRPSQEPNLRRAAAHYAGAIRALNASEGWPEGPSYWIYNRALPYALAADCFISATGLDSIDSISIRAVMRKIGLWSLYQLGPNGIFEPYGDSVGSLRLGDTGYWEASIDYFARVSRDPAVMAASDLFRQRSPVPYGKRPVHWYAALAYDPAGRPPGYDPANPQAYLRDHLPQSMLFGRDTLGVAFMRNGWEGPDELFATFKAGDLLAHHDHYDTGTFSIQLGGLLAPLTGVYGASPYDGAYRLGYAAQTVASNGLLILAPGESARNLTTRKDPAWTALSGGQRVISPTGFDCVDLDHFRRSLNSGPHLERATITAFESIPGALDYIAADITAAYNSTRFAEQGAEAKVSLVTRQFVYLRAEQAFVVFDRIETTRPTFTPKFLLHSLSKPRGRSEKLLSGLGPSDGILATRDRTLATSDQRGVLTHIALLPKPVRTLKIGGPSFSGYVESSGDQSAGFRGRNLAPDPGKGDASPKPKGLWRVEVEPAAPGLSHRFLNVLFPRLASDSRPLPKVQILKSGPGAVALRIGNSLVVFSRDPRPLESLNLKVKAGLQSWILDARPNTAYHLDSTLLQSSPEGVLSFTWPHSARTLSSTPPR
ncbi:MAG: hypothetical protein HZB13_18525 [Acidobacteria bacterium]|nr:hypothetical protein [Acidobacteriota bacterium]